jgi:hypothetical protein
VIALFAGVDTHKDSLAVGVIDQAGMVLATRQVFNTEAGFEQLSELLERHGVRRRSRGGWTHVSNGQILCKRHNREKRASIPFNWRLRGLAKRRAAYYPPGQPGTVIRRRPRSRRRPSSGRKRRTADS